MPHSLKAKFKKMLYNNRISDDEYNAFVNKLDNHDKVVYKQAIDDVIKEINNQINVAKNNDDSSGYMFGVISAFDYCIKIVEQLKR